MSDPPVSPGALQPTVADPLPAVAETPVGGPGTVAGVTALDGPDAGPSPASLVATTVNVYVVPLTRPGTAMEMSVPAAVAVAPPGEAETVYFVMLESPVSPGAAQDTVAVAFPPVADTAVGAPGGTVPRPKASRRDSGTAA